MWLHAPDAMHIDDRQITALFSPYSHLLAIFYIPSCPILALRWLIELGIVKSSPLISFLPVDRFLAFLRRHEARYVEDIGINGDPACTDDN